MQATPEEVQTPNTEPAASDKSADCSPAHLDPEGAGLLAGLEESDAEQQETSDATEVLSSSPPSPEEGGQGCTSVDKSRVRLGMANLKVWEPA